MNFNLNSGWGKVATNGLPFLGTGRHFFVGDSSTPNLDMIQQLFGYRSDALGTLRFFDDVDEAIGACTAGAGDTIFVLPNHAETITAAGGWAIDVAGVSIVGIGQGENRPIITFGTNASASITNSAANCRIANLVFKCNVASQNHMLDLTADDFIIEDCDFREGTQTGLSFITADGSDADCDRLTIRRCKFHAPTAGNYDNAISLAKDFTGVRISDCEFYGDFDDACISIPAGGNAQVDCQIKNVIATNLQSGQHAIEINSNTSTGKIINVFVETDALATSVDAGGLEMFNVFYHDGTDQAGWTPLAAQPDSVANILGADDADNGFASTNVADNRDGSVLERLESIIATLRDDVASNFIGVDDADNVAATTNVVKNGDGSILERLELLQQAVPAVALDRNAGNYLSVTADFTSATWNTVAAHEIATVTGMVHLVIIPEVTGAPTSAGSAATLVLGDETTTNSIIAATDAENLATGEVWFDTTDTRTLAAKSIFEKTDVVVGGGKDIGYTVGTEALTGGSIVFHMWWWPISSTGAVAAGAGGAL